jgi:hypothetical protein
MPKRPERSLRTVLMYLPERRAAELAIQLGGDPSQPFNPNLYPPATTVADLLSVLEDEELWHLAMAWCHRRGEPPLPRGSQHRHELLEALLRTSYEPDRHSVNHAGAPPKFQPFRLPGREDFGRGRRSTEDHASG